MAFSNTKLRAFLLFIAIASAISCSSSDRVDSAKLYDRSALLAASLEYEKILTELHAYPWEKAEDPSLLTWYCEALVETRKPLPHVLTSSSLPTHVREFAQGYLHLLQGDLKKAGNGFVQLKNLSGEARAWGHIGLLEYALLTKNITKMEDSLGALEILVQQDPSAVPSWMIPHYSAWYHFYSGRFEEVEKILPQLAQEQKVNPLDLTELKIGLALRNNQFEEAQRALNDLPPKYRNTQDASALAAEIIWLKEGPEQSMKYLKGKMERHPHWWLIKWWHASALIEMGQHQEGLDRLMSLAQSRPFNLQLQVDLIRGWMYYGKADTKKEHEEYVDQVLRNSLNIAQLPSYRIYVAAEHGRHGRHEEARKEFAVAEALYPKNPNLHWAMFYFYRDIQEYDSANHALQEWLDVDTHEVAALIARMELSYLMGEWKEVFKVEKALAQSPRYISERQWDEVKSYKAFALAGQGIKKEAREVLAAIKDPAIRADVSVKIKSPPKQRRKQIDAVQQARGGKKIKPDKKCKAVVQDQKAQFIFPYPGHEDLTWYRSETRDNYLEYSWTIALEGLQPKYPFEFGVYLFKFPGLKEQTGSLKKLISKTQASVWERATSSTRGDLPIETLIEQNRLIILVSNRATFEALFAHKPTVAHCRVHTPYKHLNFETSTRIEYQK